MYWRGSALPSPRGKPEALPRQCRYKECTHSPKYGILLVSWEVYGHICHVL